MPIAQKNARHMVFKTNEDSYTKRGNLGTKRTPFVPFGVSPRDGTFHRMDLRNLFESGPNIDLSQKNPYTQLNRLNRTNLEDPHFN